MKKITILLFFITAGFVSVAQNSKSTPQKSTDTETIYTSLKPADGQGAVFTTREELDAKVEDKKEKIKALIKENAGNAERVKFYREELWRFENAVVQQNK